MDTPAIAVKGDRIEHELVPGFVMEVEDVEACEQTGGRNEPHLQFQITDPDGNQDWFVLVRREEGGLTVTAPTAGKLVRDKIPDIIRAQGAEPCVRIASPAEYRQLLRDKLREETDEALTAGDDAILGELADVLEVVYAIAAFLGTDAGRLDEVRAAKFAERGGFAGRIVWSGNLPAGDPR